MCSLLYNFFQSPITSLRSDPDNFLNNLFWNTANLHPFLFVRCEVSHSYTTKKKMRHIFLTWGGASFATVKQKEKLCLQCFLFQYLFFLENTEKQKCPDLMTSSILQSQSLNFFTNITFISYCHCLGKLLILTYRVT